MFIARLNRLYEGLVLCAKRPRNCASAKCASAPTLWQRIFAGAARVRVHDSAFCFPDCFERELVRRLEQISFAPVRRAENWRRLPLGLLILSRGRLTSEQLRQALELQKTSGAGRIGEALQQLGYACEHSIASALAMQWSCSLIKTMPAGVSECAIPLCVLQKFRMVPVHFSSARRVLHIAFAEKIQYEALFAIERILGCKTEACLTTPTQLDAALRRREEQKHYGGKLFAGASDAQEITRIVCSYVSTMQAAEIRVTACGEQLVWARIFVEEHFEDLLFSRIAESAWGSPAQKIPQRIPG